MKTTQIPLLGEFKYQADEGIWWGNLSTLQDEPDLMLSGDENAVTEPVVNTANAIVKNIERIRKTSLKAVKEHAVAINWQHMLKGTEWYIVEIRISDQSMPSVYTVSWTEPEVEIYSLWIVTMNIQGEIERTERKNW